MNVTQVLLGQQPIQLIKHDLARPLLIAQAKNGMLACGYINPITCDKTGEACAIVTGVSSFEDMVVAKVTSVSEKAAAMGVQIGDTGQIALEKMG